MDSQKRALLHKTISTNAFYLLVKDALEQKEPLSVVRMADGERGLMQQCRTGNPEGLIDPPHGHTEAWLTRYGVLGITKSLLAHRLNYAALNCTYFAPSLSGIDDAAYSVYGMWPERPFYVDNWYPDAWTVQQKIALFKAAGHVLLIHGNPHTADSMQLRVQANLAVKVSYIPMSQWFQAPGVVDAAREINAPLVIISSGPASKWIGPAISKGGKIPKVTLDLGHAMDFWTMSHLPIDRTKAEAFHREWANRKY